MANNKAKKNQKKVTGGKKFRNAKTSVAAKEIYTLNEAVQTVKACSFANFDETVELVLRLGVDPRHSDQMVRGMVAMPNGTGRSVRVAVFAKDAKVAEALEAGADIVGSDDLIESITKGEISFDVCIASPDMMGLVGRVAKILGPKGLMPNPKLGTVTVNVIGAIKTAKAGQVEYRTEKAGIIHSGIAKKSFSDDAICENIKALVGAVVKAKPAGAKGTYLKSAYLCTTMSPAVKLDVSTLN